MIILGINAYHGDSSACLVADGKLICAIEEERIRRIKHWAGLPTESIKWCLKYAGLNIEDVDHIAISRNPYARLHKKIFRVFKKLANQGFIKSRLQNIAKIRNLKYEIASSMEVEPAKIKAKFHNVEHHRAHIGSTFLVSPFEKAVCVTVDGFGDFVSVMRATGEGTRIKINDVVEYPHSLGIFYTAFTQYLGFLKYGDEYKVMGLSALGEPVYTDEIKKMFRFNNGLFELDTTYFLHDSEGVEMTWLNAEPQIGRIYSDKFVEHFGLPREKDGELSKKYCNIASSIQRVYEDVFFYILNNSIKAANIGKGVKSGWEKLCLAGGCIQNSLANGKIFDRTPFDDVYIPPAAHDAGTAIGSAFWVWNVILGNKRDFVMNLPYWGPVFTDEEIDKLIKLRSAELREKGCEIREIQDSKEVCRTTAEKIAEGKIVGWFQGRTEWGPRALGNRSILVDPRRKEMKDILNARIKRREWFRPFAPSVLVEHVSEWFEGSHPVPFMEKVYRIKTEKRDLIPAVTHVDGTGRLQTVAREMNPMYHQLIEEFYKITKVPIVLNTSFNENEPIVNIPDDALNCFLRTRMDLLVMGRYIISQSQQTK
jgi:carbamoyltransferase